MGFGFGFPLPYPPLPPSLPTQTLLQNHGYANGGYKMAGINGGSSPQKCIFVNTGAAISICPVVISVRLIFISVRLIGSICPFDFSICPIDRCQIRYLALTFLSVRLIGATFRTAGSKEYPRRPMLRRIPSLHKSAIRRKKVRREKPTAKTRTSAHTTPLMVRAASRRARARRCSHTFLHLRPSAGRRNI